MHVEPPELQKMRVIVAYGPYRVGDIIRPFSSARSGLLWRQWAEDYKHPKPGDRDIEEEYRKLYATLPPPKPLKEQERLSGDLVGFQSEPVNEAEVVMHGFPSSETEK